MIGNGVGWHTLLTVITQKQSAPAKSSSWMRIDRSKDLAKFEIYEDITILINIHDKFEIF